MSNDRGTFRATGIHCRFCGAGEFRTFWQVRQGNRCVRAVCAACGRMVRWLELEGAPHFEHRPYQGARDHPAFRPPPPSWRWLGMIRTRDGKWRCVNDATSLSACWDALMTTWQTGDYLVMPSRPEGYEGLEE